MIDSAEIQIQLDLNFSGQWLADLSDIFSVDSTYPNITNELPSNGTLLADPSLNITIQFDEEMNQSSVEGAASISGDGRYVAFDSDADNLLGTTVSIIRPFVYVRDRLIGTTSLVSVPVSPFVLPNAACTKPSISIRLFPSSSAW